MNEWRISWKVFFPTFQHTSFKKKYLHKVYLLLLERIKLMWNDLNNQHNYIHFLVYHNPLLTINLLVYTMFWHLYDLLNVIKKQYLAMYFYMLPFGTTVSVKYKALFWVWIYHWLAFFQDSSFSFLIKSVKDQIPPKCHSGVENCRYATKNVET